jgi:hypothetical protein
MVFDPAQDKRQSARYLCDEHFTKCVLLSETHTVEVTAIDFSTEGMGLFSNEHVPESGSFKLSMEYNNPGLQHRFDSLPCTLVYCNLTEVGSHCGIRFELSQLAETDVTALQEIESTLATHDDPEDRYHLFGDE